MEDFFDFLIELLEENRLYIFLNKLNNNQKQLFLLGLGGLYLVFFNFMNELMFECFKVVVAFMSGTTGILLSCVLVSQLKFKKIEDGFKFYEEELKYGNKYSLEDLKENEDFNKENIKSTRFVQECTPDGSIFLRWNIEKDGFEYWSNNDIKYIYLETVARKYCKVFNCKSLYIDRNKEIEEKKEKLKQEEEIRNMSNEDKEEGEGEGEGEGEEDKEHNSVFVKLKTNKNTEVKKEKEIVATNSNKYVHSGKISELNLLDKDVETELKFNSKKKMTFSDFKNYFSSN